MRTTSKAKSTTDEKMEAPNPTKSPTYSETSATTVPIWAKRIQRKLIVGHPNDPYEREADAVADQVMRKPAQGIQRRCACGGAAGPHGECAACRDKRLQRSSISALSLAEEEEETVQRSTTTATTPATVPVSVHETLRRPGNTLDGTASSDMESRFGTDFSGVRIHTDAEAAQSAADVYARAYTVGQHIVFGAGQYNPHTEAGLHLLAHELTHVIQQGRAGDTLQRLPMPFLPPGPIVDLIVEYVMDQVNSCNPSRSLTWADFQGSVPNNSPHSAETALDIQAVTINGQNVIQAVFDSANSWVEPKFGNPTRANTNCGSIISSCETFFTNEAAAGRTGGSYGLNPPSGAQCAASVSGFVPATANNTGECDTVLGPACDRGAQNESQRLLKHEQYHMNLACALAFKGTRLLRAQPTLSPASVRAEVVRVNNQQQIAYDNNTRHGCIAAQQASWESDIDAGLPNITISVSP